MTLLERVKELCIKNSTSLAALEKTLSMGNGTLSRWDTSSPSIDKIQKVANHFNVSIDYLVGQGDVYNLSLNPKANEAAGSQSNFYALFEELAEILGYKIGHKRGDTSFIQYAGKETPLKTEKIVTIMDSVQSYINFTLQEAIKNTNEECSEDYPTIVVAARGGRYKLDRSAAQKLAQSAAKAPNRAHDKELF